MALKPDWMTRIRNEASGVQKFDLEGNALDALPSSLADLPRLKAISLKSNEFKVFPEVLLQITRLTELILSENQLKVLPDGISSLRHLKVLELSDNNELTALPNGFCDLTALTRLKAENCGLESLPEDFGELSALQELDISHNSFVRLPESMGALTSLITCDLSINHLQRIPPSMGYIQSLRELKIDQNDLPETYRAAAVGQGISGLLSFLRKEDERERQEEIERMKPVGKVSKRGARSCPGLCGCAARAPTAQAWGGKANGHWMVLYLDFDAIHAISLRRRWAHTWSTSSGSMRTGARNREGS